MRNLFKWIVAVQMVGLGVGTAAAQLPNCPLRPTAGSVVLDAMSLSSQNGALSLALTERNGADSTSIMHYCFDYSTANGDVESPTLRLNPGDTLTLDLTNQLNLVGVIRMMSSTP
jgi:FtsP/CotA-like multicopper oxidase with cupredoxin domain